MLRDLVPKLSRSLTKQLSSKSMQTRQIGFHLLCELVTVLHGGLDEQVELFIPAIETSLASTDSDHHHVALTSNLKIEVLTFLRRLFRTHASEQLHPYMSRLCPAIITTISDRFYKITSEAFLLCIELIKAIRPISHNRETGEYTVKPLHKEYTSYVEEIFRATIKTLSTSDVDQEVKERSIMCLGTLLGHVSDVLQEQQKQAWDIFLERLKNEVTRLISVRTLAIICQSPVADGPEMRNACLSSVDEIAQLLRKSNRALRIASTECLRILIRRYDILILALLQPPPSRYIDLSPGSATRSLRRATIRY